MQPSPPLPVPPDIPGYSWRPLRREDIPSVYRMMVEIDRVDQMKWPGSRESLERDFDDPWSAPKTDTLAAFDAQGEVVALGRTSSNPTPQDKAMAFLGLEVHPDHRGRGLGDFLLSWAEARARQKLDQVPAHLPRIIRAFAPAHLEDRSRLLEQMGFTMVRCFFRMRRDLNEPMPSVPDIPSIEMRTFTPDLDHAMMGAFNATFQDHWGFDPVDEREWTHRFTGNKDFRADLTPVAMAGNQMAGYSIGYVHPDENHRLGLKQAWIGQLGVVREWRRKGLGTVLLLKSMEMFKEAGMEYAVLVVDSENLTGALGIYERVGYETVLRFLVYSKDVGSTST